MSKLPFIIIGLLSLVACKTDKTSVPQDFECFNQPHIYIKYKQPINGYTVKVMWLGRRMSWRFIEDVLET